MTIAAGAAVAVKGFTLGLDLRGGLEVVLKARPTHGQSISADTLSQAADVMRRRIDPRGILQPEIRTSQGDSTIDISIPGVKNPNAVANLLVAGQLQSFDFYDALTPVVSTQEPEHRAAAPVALRHAERRQEADPDGQAGRVGALLAAAPHNLVRANGIVSRIEPQQEPGARGHPPEGERAAAGRRLAARCPRGTQAVSCTDALPGRDQPAGTVWYLFRPPTEDSEIVTGDEISSAKADIDPPGNPIVSLSYKNGGDQDFTDITRQIAQAGARSRPAAGL